MGESWQHVFLVNRLINWVEKQEKPQISILADTALYSSTQRPFKIEGNIPDLYASYYIGEEKKVIIGEAKTHNDLDNNHTYEQIASFIKYCNQNNGSLVMAVYWDQVVLCNDIIKAIITELSVAQCEYWVIKKLFNTSKNAENYFKK